MQEANATSPEPALKRARVEPKQTDDIDDKEKLNRCEWVLELHPNCRMDDLQKELLKEAGLYTIDIDQKKYGGMLLLRRSDFKSVVDRLHLGFMSNTICLISLQLNTSPRPLQLKLYQLPNAKNRVYVNKKPIEVGDFHVLYEGDEVVFFERADSFELKYVVARRPGMIRSIWSPSTQTESRASIDQIDPIETCNKCEWMLELHSKCNISEREKENLRRVGQYNIDPSIEKYLIPIKIGRKIFMDVFQPDITDYVSRYICSISVQICPAHNPWKLRILQPRGTTAPVYVNDKLIDKGRFHTLEEGDEVVFIRRSMGFELKYIVVKREKEMIEKVSSIGVLFAAPLVEMTPDGKKTALPDLDFQAEGEVLRECIAEASIERESLLSNSSQVDIVRVPRNINLRVHFATRDTFQEWSRGLQALHFSGHGNDHSPHEIVELLPKDHSLKLVFIASCASANMAHAFVAHGIPHVVGTKLNTELEDKAAIAFTKDFFEDIVRGRTVREAFIRAQTTVAHLANTRQPEEVAKKFELLPEGGNHDVVIFPLDDVELFETPPDHSGQIASSQLDSLSQLDTLDNDESPPLSPSSPPTLFPTKLPALTVNYGFRNLELHELFTLLHRHRLVTVTGPTGIGKTQIAIAAARYMDMRKPHRHQVHVCSVSSTLEGLNSGDFLGCDSIESIWERVLSRIELSVATNVPSDHLPDLIVFDGCDDLLGNSLLQDLFEAYLQRLFSLRPNLQILLTACHRLQLKLINGDGELPLNPLTLVDGARLLLKFLNRPLEAHYAKLKVGVPPEDLSSDEMAAWISKSPAYRATQGVPKLIENLAHDTKVSL
ncbi:hypothetical protein Ae201684P_002565 [Aphanomyces euteiches]|nr:hypothetical protein Ae201684P_002565 [Aphanomyces euteiches]